MDESNPPRQRRKGKGKKKTGIGKGQGNGKSSTKGPQLQVETNYAIEATKPDAPAADFSEAGDEWGQKLPHEILVHIFQYCTGQDIGRCFLVCKKWHNASTDGHVWRQAILRDFLLDLFLFEPPTPTIAESCAKQITKGVMFPESHLLNTCKQAASREKHALQKNWKPLYVSYFKEEKRWYEILDAEPTTLRMSPLGTSLLCLQTKSSANKHMKHSEKWIATINKSNTDSEIRFWDINCQTMVMNKRVYNVPTTRVTLCRNVVGTSCRYLSSRGFSRMTSFQDIRTDMVFTNCEGELLSMDENFIVTCGSSVSCLEPQISIFGSFLARELSSRQALKPKSIVTFDNGRPVRGFSQNDNMATVLVGTQLHVIDLAVGQAVLQWETEILTSFMKGDKSPDFSPWTTIQMVNCMVMADSCQMTDLRTGRVCWTAEQEAYTSPVGYFPRGLYFDERKLLAAHHNKEGFSCWDLRKSTEPFCEVSTGGCVEAICCDDETLVATTKSMMSVWHVPRVSVQDKKRQRQQQAKQARTQNRKNTNQH